MTKILSMILISIISLFPFIYTSQEDEPDYIDDDGVYYYYDDDYYYEDEGDKPRVQYCYKGQEVDFPEVARSGYILRGWSEDGVNLLSSYTVTHNAELFALWAKEISTITVHGNGGYIEGEKDYSFLVEGFSNISQVLSELEIIRNGNYLLKGFYYDSDLTIPLDSLDEVYDDLDIYCEWEKSTAIITLILFGGMIDDTKDEYLLEVNKRSLIKDSLALTIPTKHGYVFSGWYYDEEYKDEVLDSDLLFEDTTLYAKYDLVDVKATFCFLGSDSTTIKDSYSINVKCFTPLKEILPDFGNLYYKVLSSYYTFDGWYSSKLYSEEYLLDLEGNVDYLEEESPQVIYYAFFKYPVFNLTLDPGGGINKTSPTLEFSLTEETFNGLSLSADYTPNGEVNPYVSKDGYLFECWRYDGQKLTYENFLTLLYGKDSYTIVADYTEAYTITFVCKEDEYFSGYQNTAHKLTYLIKIGTWFNSPPIVLTVEGKELKDWNVSSDDLENSDISYLNPNGMNMPSGSLTFSSISPNDINSGEADNSSWFKENKTLVIVLSSVTIVLGGLITLFFILKKKRKGRF